MGDALLYNRNDGVGVDPRPRDRSRIPGHNTEAGRVTGFLIGCIANAKTAGPEDLLACQRSLKKLHSLGILHGDINKYNFLVRDGGVVIVDFETASRTGDEGELEKEYQRLEALLRNPFYEEWVGVFGS